MQAYKQALSTAFSEAETTLLTLLPSSPSIVKGTLLSLHTAVWSQYTQLTQTVRRLQAMDAQKHALFQQRAKYAEELAGKKQRKAAEAVRLLTEENGKLRERLDALKGELGAAGEWRVQWKSELPRPDVQRILEECEEEKLYLQHLVDTFQQRLQSPLQHSPEQLLSAAQDCSAPQQLRRNEGLQQANDMLQYKLKCCEVKADALRVTAEELTRQLQVAKHTIKVQSAELDRLKAQSSETV